MREGSGQAAGRVPQVGAAVPVGGGQRATVQPERHRIDGPASLHSKRPGQDGTAGEQAGGPDPAGINWPPFVVHTHP